MELPPQKRQRLIWRLAKYGVIAAAKRHVRNQESPDGQKWPGRKTKRKGKMLRNLPKLLHIREMPEIQAVRIYLQGGGYRNGEAPVPAGTVGYAQQNGMRVKVSRSSQPRKADAGKMATPARLKTACAGISGENRKTLEKAHAGRYHADDTIQPGRITDSKAEW